jgi:hypothetical protein
MEPIKEESISLTERTQSDSSVPKIPMDFNEFKSRYNELLDYHLNQNSYHNELTFVGNWFDKYSKLSNLLQKTSKPEPLTSLEMRGLKKLGTKNHYCDLELSFSLICNFLKQRKKEVKKELKAKPEPPQRNEIENPNKIPFPIMNEAILSIQSSLVDNKKPPQQPEDVKPDEVYKTQNLFKVGLLFATGEMNKYFTLNSNKETLMKVGYSAGKIAKELRNDAYNKWILATINNYTADNKNGNKNVFNSLEMMTKIIDHCKAGNLTIDPYFTSRLPID